ncbi:hypothetical protein [Streptomyces sp. NPDC002535]
MLERDAGLEGDVHQARGGVVAARGGGEGVQVHPAVPALVAEGREVGELLPADADLAATAASPHATADRSAATRPAGH